MHDRRIDGIPHTFGNYGALFMNAMTWWDHETSSIWSQPWGRAIDGENYGVELFLLPSEVTTWGNWRAEHPESLAMINDVDRLIGGRRQGFSPNYVLGLLLDGQSKAYYYGDVAAAGLINDRFAGQPVVVWADEGGLNAYFSHVDDRELVFELADGRIADLETRSEWDLGRGLAIAGELAGSALQPVPSSSSFDWAWLDFYPDAQIYVP